MRRSRRKRAPNIGLLAWIVFLLFVIVLYLLNHNRIREVLTSTRFVEVVFENRNEQPTETVVPVPAPVPPQTPAEPSAATPQTTTVEPQRLTPDSALPAPDPQPVPAAPQPVVPEQQPAANTETSTVTVAPPAQAPSEVPAGVWRAQLYFVRLGDDGRIHAAPVERRVRYTSSPLTETIRALLVGPTVDDLNRGVISVIPEGTQLLSAAVRDGVAYLNFNEAFRFNSFGAEGNWAQLQQVVFTATAFQTVNAVQIQIEGRTVSYLSGDGVFVGEPLRRSDF